MQPRRPIKTSYHTDQYIHIGGWVLKLLKFLDYNTVTRDLHSLGY